MIRKITYADIPKIIEMENNVLGTTLGEVMFNLAVTSPLAYYYVYEENDEILGYISTQFDGEIIEVLNFCVLPDNQRSGIGSKLFEHVILHCKDAKSIILEVRESNQKAISFYYKHGLRLIQKRKGYYSNGEDAYVYNKSLISSYTLEDEYIKVFTNCQDNLGYKKYYDDSFKNKYYHNYYYIYDNNNQDSLVNILINKPINDNINFLTTKPLNNSDGFEVEHNILMHAFSFNYKQFNKENGIPELVNDDSLDDCLELIYNDALEFGESFAIGNKNSFKKAYLDKKINLYIIRNEEKPVGFVSTFIYGDSAKIEDFFVLEEYHHKGYGATLFTFVVNNLKKRNIIDLYLAADYDDTPKEMYEKMGFIKFRDLYFSRKV